MSMVGWLRRHPRFAGWLETRMKRLDDSNFFEYEGTLSMLLCCTFPAWLLATITGVVALVLWRHPWNWIALGFGIVAVWYTVAAVWVWFEDRKRIKKGRG